MEGPVQGPDDVFLDHLTTLATLLQGALEQRTSYAYAHVSHKGLLTSSEGTQKAMDTGGELKFMHLAYNYYL